MPELTRGLTLARSVEGSQLTLGVEGELDLDSAGVLADALAELEPGVTVVALDLAGLTFVDSSGLIVLVREHRRLDGLGIALELHRVDEGLLRLLDLTELVDYLRVVERC